MNTWHGPLLAMMLILYGCALSDSPDAPSREQIAQENKLILEVERALTQADSQFNRLPVQVMALNTEVVLIGQVPDSQSRVLAQETALGLAGVSGLHNHLMIGPTRAASIAAQDSLLAINARTRLSRLREVPSRNYQIEVDYGRAFVIGRLNAEQQQLVVEQLQQVGGLQSIVLIVN